jgi:DNA transposition AAA+ family ATPase
MLTTETKKQIMDELDAWMLKHNLSAGKVAERAGLNPSYLSLMRSGKYSMPVGDNQVEIADKYFISIAELIGKKLKKEYWSTVATGQMLRIIATLEDARENGLTNVLIGETGSGKTYVADIFAAKYPTDTFKITVSSQDNIADLLEKTCERIGIATEKSKSKTLRAIGKKLKGMKAEGMRPVLMFDEAEYMKQPSLCNMKELYDALNGICSIILLGTDQLMRHIDKLRKKNRDGIPQLYRRIKYGIIYLPSIDRTFKQFTEGLGNDVAKFVRTNCDNYGELHDVLVPAFRESDRTGEEVTENMIRRMLNMPAM